MLSEQNKNRIERSFDVLKRIATGTTTIERQAKESFIVSTEKMPMTSVKISEFQKNKAMVFEEESVSHSRKEDVKLIKEAMDEAKHRNVIATNKYFFKCPLNLVILSHSNEREFAKYLTDKDYVSHIDAWIKSVDRGFYSIPYSYRKGTHQKEAKFNPDFFIKIGKDILVIEIKGDEDITAINKAKLRYAKRHFEEVNKKQSELTYYFKFLSPTDYSKFFEFLKKGTYQAYVSNLEAELES